LSLFGVGGLCFLQWLDSCLGVRTEIWTVKPVPFIFKSSVVDYLEDENQGEPNELRFTQTAAAKLDSMACEPYKLHQPVADSDTSSDTGRAP